MFFASPEPGQFENVANSKTHHKISLLVFSAFYVCAAAVLTVVAVAGVWISLDGARFQGVGDWVHGVVGRRVLIISENVLHSPG